VHSLIRGARDEEPLANVLDRLDRAKTVLSFQIIITDVGISRDMLEGFLGEIGIIQRVDRNVQRVLGQRLTVAVQLVGRQNERDGKWFLVDVIMLRPSVLENGNIPLMEEDIRALNPVDKVQ
jgi:hypothetical protein